ncbi:MAG: ATP-dependent RecD-like DNA helicase [Aggregatilineales bacterium]
MNNNYTPPTNLDTFSGTVERITYYNDENGYSVIKVIPDKRMPSKSARDGTVTVVGTMPELRDGESVEFTGEWIEDSKYGTQLKVQTLTPIAPNSLEGMKRYLASGLVRGIGPATAEKIVNHFGLETMDVLNRNPERLQEVPEVKTKLLDDLAKAWEENYAVRQTMVFLQQYGVSSRMATRIQAVYGAETVNKVKENAYALADEVFGIGFIKADQIARAMGLAMDSPERLRAGLGYTLSQLANDGHTYAPRDMLMDSATNLLSTDNRMRLKAVLEGQIMAKELISDTMPDEDGTTHEAIYLPGFHRAETQSSERLKKMAFAPSEMTEESAKIEWTEFLAELARENEVDLTDQQQGAVKAALTRKVTVLTGGPGTGKTTTLRMVIAALRAENYRFALASPTGRAAKRLGEATGEDAYTIHRLLGYSPAEGFASNEEHPLKVDMLIVDESSMIDLMLFHHMLKALLPETHLMLVGDIDQLPSVGAGNVLRDVIDSGVAFVTRLETIFRQEQDSHIVVNAHRINHGEAPYMDNQSEDFYFFREEDPARAAELVVDVVKNRIPNKFGFDPMNDIQVIAPMYRGPSGVTALNDILQEALNGSTRKADKLIAGRKFRVGDKVMQTRNNYDKEVFNGDIGRIYAIDYTERLIEVVFDGRYVDFDFTDAEELMHAYCISTHRSQGSEYPVVVMPVLTQFYMMLQRNLLYTAITRARKMVVMVGSHKAVYMAVKNNKVSERYSGLVTRLREGGEG